MRVSVRREGREGTSKNERRMSIRVGLVGVGEMGSAIGATLRERGARVVTSLEGRSKESVARAERSGIEVVADRRALVRGSEIVLSIVPPGAALAVARELAPALREADTKPVFVDCNAISPATVGAIAECIATSRAPFVDGGIIGGPPRAGYDGPRLYVCGADASRVAGLEEYGLSVPVLDGPVGSASALKMCYASLTKGLMGIGSAMFAEASRHGLEGALDAELAHSQPVLREWLARQVPTIGRKAYRWVAEMEEIASFSCDQPAVEAIYHGLARYYRSVAENGRPRPASHAVVHAEATRR
jgi:3-hydroxyisobutyrate dehydrogenase-like beta-hydroxyacid dehydrogenase